MTWRLFGIGLSMFSTIILFSVFLFNQLVDATPDSKKDETTYFSFKASEYVADLEYDLKIHADGTPYGSHYWGRIYITMKCGQKTNKIFLDQKSIGINEKTIKAWQLTGIEDRGIPVHYGRIVSKGNGFKIKLEEYMQVGNTYRIRLEFLKSIYTESVGFVSQNYRLSHDNLRDILYTKMQKHNAHYVFPCFNDVSLKATFKIRIGHLKDVNSFTNAKFVTSELIDNPRQFLSNLGSHEVENLKSTFCKRDYTQKLSDCNLPQIWVVDEFEKTNPISTFSVALAVVKYNSIEPINRLIGPPGTDHENVEIKIWAERDFIQEDHVEKVLRVADQSLAFFAEFFDSKYKLGKLDLIVLPDDDITVEDYYGLIYLGEKTVKYVFTESINYRADRHLLVSKICQSMSKQWIGHLVSLSDWHEEWFYDGLHTYFERLCIVQTFPHWKHEIQLDLIDSFIGLLRDEERGDDHTSILRIGYHSATLNQGTKSKISIVVRMLIYILEEKPKLFQKILTTFINQHENTSLSLRKVWQSWAETTNAEQNIFPKRVTINSIVESWLYRRGHPLIKVLRNEMNGVILVSQERFKFPDQKGESQECWPISFEIMTKNRLKSGQVKERHWLSCTAPESSISLQDVKVDAWIIVTTQLHVPGRIHYDAKSWSLIKTLFHSEEISSIDDFTKVQLIHDMFSLAEASYLKYNFVFETLKYISKENDYKCWHVVYQELKRLRSHWMGTSLLEPLQEFAHTLIHPALKMKVIKIGDFSVSSNANNMLGKIIINAACTFEHPQCKEYSENLLNNIMSDPNYEYHNPIPEFFQECFYCMAMKNADDRKWEFLLKKYEEKPQDKWILRALGCSKNPKILKNFLTWSLNVQNTKKLQVPHLSLDVFEILSSSDEGYQLIIPYFKISRLRFSNANTIVLKDFISAVGTDITIEEFFLIALRGAKKSSDEELLTKFSNSLKAEKAAEEAKAKKDQKTEKELKKDTEIQKAELEAYKIVKRAILWFQKEEKELLNYFSTLSNYGT